MAVTLYHRALDRTVTVSDGRARSLRSSGWTDVEPDPEELRRPARRSTPALDAISADPADETSPTSDLP